MDGMVDLIFGQGMIEHIYWNPGNFVITVIPDGEDTIEGVGGVKVAAPPPPASVVVADATTAPTVCPVLTIPDVTLTCGTPFALENRIWTVIDDANGCGEFTAGDPSGGGFPAPFAVNQFAMQIRSDTNNNHRTLFVSTLLNNPMFLPTTPSCGTSGASSVYVSTVTSLPGGKVYTVSLTATFTINSSMVSNVTFTPP